MDTRSGINPRPLIEVTERARPSVNDKYVRRLVDAGLLPTPVYTIVYQNTHGSMQTKETRAKSARWLAILKRDYPEEYEKLIAENQQEMTNP